MTSQKKGRPCLLSRASSNDQEQRVGYLTLRPSQVAAAHSHLSVVHRTVPQAAKVVLAGATCRKNQKQP